MVRFISLKADKNKKFLINFLKKQVMIQDLLSLLFVGSLRALVFHECVDNL